MSVFDACLIPDMQQSNHKIHIGEPDLSNPNSFVTVTHVLRNIGHRTGKTNYYFAV